jgi:signal transduction histidine kinase
MSSVTDNDGPEPATPTLGGAAPIVAVDHDGTILKANARAKKVLKSLNAELVGANLGAVLGELGGAREDDPPPSFSLPGSSESPQRVFVVVSEADTARQEAESDVVADTGLELRRLLDFIAHELKSPVGAIAGLAGYLHSHAFAAEEDRESAVEAIRLDAERALLVLDSILSLAQNRKKSQTRLATVPLHSVARRVIEAHRRRHPERGITISGDAPVYARADSTWLEMALDNLIVNADKYSPAGRDIEVSIHQSGSRASIRIMDSGTGLEAASYGRIWDVYETAAESESLIKGSGIGLALCKELVESMQGEVWAGPRQDGGSVFSITLQSAWLTAFPRAPTAQESGDAVWGSRSDAAASLIASPLSKAG